MKYLIILLITILLGSVFLLGFYLPRKPGTEETTIFLVKKGESAKEISLNLKEQGLINSSLLFRIYALATNQAVKLQAGEYELSPAMNIPEIVAKLVSGEVIKRQITIIGGWTIKDVEEYLGGKIDPKLEGYLFPDTYEVNAEDNVEEIVQKILDNFDKKVRSHFGAELTPEAVIMASLLEKEVKTPEDKKIVSGILWKRLKVGMPLQVDAAPDTYKYQGLPPSPICNPGLESIEAAIYPQESEYWYYLSASDGKTIFSKTLAEHNIAKAKYLK